MKIDVLTLFPDFFSSIYNWSIIGRAIEKDILDIECTNIRDFSKNKHKKVDDYPYGGGPGMVMTPEPLFESINSVKKSESKVIYMSPQGKKLNQEKLNSLSREKHIVLLCGHYEGIDNRIIDNYIDEEISIGDYVLTGGEIPAMVLIDGIVRLLPNVLSNEDSFKDESHYHGYLEYPQFTRPQKFQEYEVPEILLSGNHAEIEKWRKFQSIKNTLIKRPDLIETLNLTPDEIKLVNKIKLQLNKQ